MPPKAKRTKTADTRQERPLSPLEHGADADTDADASQLVSFLTGYDHQGHDRDDGSSDDDDGSDNVEDLYEDDVDDADEDESMATPSRRGKTGLVGTPSRSTRGTPRSTPRRKTPRKPIATPTTVQEGDEGFVRPTKSDAYFLAHSRGGKTSGNAYSALVKPLSQAEYELYAAGARRKGKGKAVVGGLMDDLAGRFGQWEMELEEGFNLLLYGYGSKRRLINRFVAERLSLAGHCVVVNGHFPGLGIRDVLAQMEDALGISQDIPVPPSASTPLDRSVHRVYTHFLPPEALPAAQRKTLASLLSTRPLFLVIHNIDAPAMRHPRAISILSLLASSPRIHLVASYDHLHAPLLFSSTLTSSPPHIYRPGSWTGTPLPSRGFHWIHHAATTYDDYDLELSYQRLSASSALTHLSSGGGGGISEEGALQIMRSVPPMALRLLKLLITRQLANLPPAAASHVAVPAAQTAPEFGIDNDILQTLAREKFIAREEERYNALMGEFRDHGLVVEATADAEGRQGRWVWIPLGKAALERVVQEMGSVEV